MKTFESGEVVIFKVFNEDATIIKKNLNGTYTIKLNTGAQIDTFPGDLEKKNDETSSFCMVLLTFLIIFS